MHITVLGCGGFQFCCGLGLAVGVVCEIHMRLLDICMAIRHART